MRHIEALLELKNSQRLRFRSAWARHEPLKIDEVREKEANMNQKTENFSKK